MFLGTEEEIASRTSSRQISSLTDQTEKQSQQKEMLPSLLETQIKIFIQAAKPLTWRPHGGLMKTLLVLVKTHFHTRLLMRRYAQRGLGRRVHCRRPDCGKAKPSRSRAALKAGVSPTRTECFCSTLMPLSSSSESSACHIPDTANTFISLRA